MWSRAESLQVAMDNGARQALIPLENKRNFAAGVAACSRSCSFYRLRGATTNIGSKVLTSHMIEYSNNDRRGPRALHRECALSARSTKRSAIRRKRSPRRAPERRYCSVGRGHFRHSWAWTDRYPNGERSACRLIEIIDDTLIEAIELRSLLLIVWRSALTGLRRPAVSGA
jgi:hypothetical protein